MRALAAMIFLTISAGAAHAQLYAAAGNPLILYQAGSTNPDCSNHGNVVMRLAAAPQHGRISFTRTGLFANFAMSDARRHCNTRRVRGVKAVYVARRGYVGPDSAAIEVIFPTGRSTRRTFSIWVR